jgi:hypothetical protein
MTIYIIYCLNHIDKLRSVPTVDILNIYQDKEKAYEYALRKQLSYIDLLDLSFDTKNNGREILMFLTDDEKSFEQRLEYFHNNIYSIFGKPKFSIKPSCNIIYVSKKDDFDDKYFESDIKEIQEMCE